jgi:hypothetical protein
MNSVTTNLMAGTNERGEEIVFGRKEARPGRVNSYRPDRFPDIRPKIMCRYSTILVISTFLLNVTFL